MFLIPLKLGQRVFFSLQAVSVQSKLGRFTHLKWLNDEAKAKPPAKNNDGDASRTLLSCSVAVK